MKCLNCGSTSFEYTNYYDEKTQKIMHRCLKCNRLFITKDELIDVTFSNDIGNILMGIDIEASLARIKKKYLPLHKLKKKLQRGE